MSTVRCLMLVVALMAFSCITESETSNERENSTEVYIELLSERRFYEKSSGECDSDTSSTCTSVTITYPWFTGTLNTDVENIVNSKVTSLLVDNMLYDSLTYGSYEAFTDSFISEYSELREDFGEAFGWQYDGDVTVIRNDSVVLSLKADTYVYTGGAHGMSLVRYLNLDPKTGETYSMQDIFSQPFHQALNDIAKRAFIDRKGLSSEKELSDQGYSFEDNRYYTENFGILSDSIVFYYNQYEVAPYAVGPTRLTLSIHSLDSLLQKKFRN